MKFLGRVLLLVLLGFALTLSLPQVALAESGDDTASTTSNSTNSETTTTPETLPKTTRDELPANSEEAKKLKDGDDEEEDDDCTLVVHNVEAVNLVDEISEIPVTVVNTCKTDLGARIIAHSEQPNVFEVAELSQGVIPAQSSAIVKVLVKAKTNGELSMVLNAEQVDNDGTVTSIASWRLKVQSTREIGQALALFTYFLVGGLIIIGIFRTGKRIHSSVKKNSHND